MASLEQRFETACKDRIIPGAVLMATNKTGSFKYAKAFGSLSLDTSTPSRNLELNSVFMIASCTKLLTSIAAMQCVERGLIVLDDDVAQVLPELAALEVLEDFDQTGKATTTKRKNPITLRLLLTHSAGLGYDGMTPKLAKYRRSRGEKLGGARKTLLDRFALPLVYEPGTSWGYGPAIDWAGRLVERLTGQSLEDYMAARLWAPLGITDMTFWPQRRADLLARRAGMTVRDPRSSSGRVVHYPGATINDGTEECLGGQGCYASMPSFLKVLHSLLAGDERLLRRETAELMFAPQLGRQGAAFLESLRDRPEIWSHFVGSFPRHVGLDWGLGGILTTQNDPGWRAEGTMMWSGLPNLFWFIDRKTGLCGVYGGQVLPEGDAQTNEMITLFEKTMYERASEAKSKM